MIIALAKALCRMSFAKLLREDAQESQKEQRQIFSSRQFFEEVNTANYHITAEKRII